MADVAPKKDGPRPLRPDESKPRFAEPSGPADTPRRGSRVLVALAVLLAGFAGYLGWRTTELA